VGSPGKTEFPADWDDGKVMENVLSVAREPDERRYARIGTIGGGFRTSATVWRSSRSSPPMDLSGPRGRARAPLVS
jgi:hypothetical protein